MTEGFALDSNLFPIKPLGELIQGFEGGVNFIPISEGEFASDWRVLKISAVTWGEFNPKESKPISREITFDESLIVKQGDLIMSRANTSELVGAVCLVRNNPPKVLLPDKLWRIKFLNNSKLLPEYTLYALRQPELRRAIAGLATGSSGSMKNISMEKAATLPIPVPSISEQKRIASILNKSDRLRRTRCYAQHLCDSFLQAVFWEMFSAFFREDSPATPMGELVTITGGGTPSRDVPRYYEGQIPWLTSKDMRGYYIFDTQEHITEEAIKESATKLVPADSILIVVKSKVLMHRLPIAIARTAMCHGQDVKSIQCSKKIEPLFLAQVIKRYEPALLAQARGANTEGLTLPMLEAIPVPTVPLPLQQKFARIVQRFERLRAQQREAARQAEHLFQTLLHRAFRGEL